MTEFQQDTGAGTLARPAETAHQDLPKPQVLNCGDCTSAGAETACLDLQKPHTSKKEKSKKEYRDTDDELPTVPRAGADDGREAICLLYTSGIRDEPLSRFLITYLRWRKNRRIALNKGGIIKYERKRTHLRRAGRRGAKPHARR